MLIQNVFCSSNHKPKEENIQETCKNNNLKRDYYHTQGQKKENCYKFMEYSPGNIVQKKQKIIDKSLKRKCGNLTTAIPEVPSAPISEDYEQIKKEYGK